MIRVQSLSHMKKIENDTIKLAKQILNDAKAIKYATNKLKKKGYKITHMASPELFIKKRLR